MTTKVRIGPRMTQVLEYVHRFPGRDRRVIAVRISPNGSDRYGDRAVKLALATGLAEVRRIGVFDSLHLTDAGRAYLKVRPNIARLDAAIGYIEEHPEEHDQRWWFFKDPNNCGTTRCLAGTVAMQDGWKPLYGTMLGETVAGTVQKNGHAEDVYDVAMTLLNLDEVDADKLFYADDLNAIKRVRDRLVAEVGR